MHDTVASALRDVLTSPSLVTSHAEPANLIDVVGALATAVRQVAGAVTPRDAAPGKDATGGSVGSLTEGIMGITAALVQIAQGLHDVAEAIREREEP